VNRLEDGTVNAIAGPERLVLRTPVALHGEDLKTVGEFTVEAGQSVFFVLSYGPSFQSPPSAINPFDALESTEAFWRQWSDRCRKTNVGAAKSIHDVVVRCGSLTQSLHTSSSRTMAVGKGRMAFHIGDLWP
jgi:hypothetical protein